MKHCQYRGLWANLSEDVQSSTIAGVKRILTQHGSKQFPQFRSYAVTVAPNDQTRSFTAGEVAEVACAVLHSAASFLIDTSSQERAKASEWFRGGVVLHPNLSRQDDVLEQVCEEWGSKKADRLCRRWLKKHQDNAVHNELLDIAVLNFWCTMRLLRTLSQYV